MRESVHLASTELGGGRQRPAHHVMPQRLPSWQQHLLAKAGSHQAGQLGEVGALLGHPHLPLIPQADARLAARLGAEGAGSAQGAWHAGQAAEVGVKRGHRLGAGAPSRGLPRIRTVARGEGPSAGLGCMPKLKESARFCKREAARRCQWGQA
jgi:hypothetical protein